MYLPATLLLFQPIAFKSEDCMHLGIGSMCEMELCGIIEVRAQNLIPGYPD